jgi:hypothetical protein
MPAEYTSRTVPGDGVPPGPGSMAQGRPVTLAGRPLDGRPKVTFEYTGKTAVAVIGGVSRLRYAFTKPGAMVEVDARDRASLAAIPNLKPK